MTVKMIMATGLNGELGKDNKLLWNIPNDLKYFKEQTEGQYVIMGRSTFDSLNLPKGLKNRKNIVLTKKDIPKNKKVIYQYNPRYYTYFTQFTTFDDFLDRKMTTEEDIWIIGGSSIYDQLIDYVDEIHWTQINKEFPEADTYLTQKVKDEIGNKFKYTSAGYCKCETSGLDYTIYTFNRIKEK